MSNEVENDGGMTPDHAIPVELSEDDMARVAGGTKTGGTREASKLQDVTNNLQTTAQKAADKADAYLRS